MRIDRLDLLAFGCFTDRTLDLSAPGVHVIAGPNEAGKSTARHAIGQLLYGIGERSPYGFVHPLAELRLGALIRDAHGAPLEIVRHKRRKNPLCAPDGTPLDERELVRALADVGADEFAGVFALDHAELRRGGQDLLDGKGDVGRALFESRSSSRLADVQDTLQKDSAALWLKGGQKPRINHGTKRITELQREVRNLALEPREFAAAEKAVTRAEEEHERLESDLRDVRARHAALARVRAVLPQLEQRRELRAAREDLVCSGSTVADNLVDELDRVTARLRKAADESAHDRAALLDTETDLGALPADTAHLDHADPLEALSAEVSAIREAEKQIALAEEELWAQRRAAEELLDGVRPGRTLDDPGAYRVDKATVDRIAALRRDLAGHDTALAAALEQETRRAAKLDAARAALAEAPSAADAAALQALVHAVPEGFAGDLTRAEQQVADRQAKCDALRARHGLTGLDDDAVVRLPLPAREQVDEHRAALDTLRGREETLAARRAETAERLDKAREDLQKLLRGTAPPTPAELDAAREARDGWWADLEAAAQPTDELKASYRQSVLHADKLADRIREHAADSLRRVDLEIGIERDTARLATHDADHADVVRTRDELAAHWAALWEPSGVDAPEPAAAPQLVEGVRDLAALIDEARASRRALDALREEETALVARFRAELENAGEPTEATALRELSGLADLRIAAAAEALRERGRAEAAERTALDELDEARDDVRRAEAARAAWETAWADVVGGLGLDGHDPDALAAAVETLATVARDADALAEATRRRDDAAARVADFDRRLTALLSAAWGAEPADGEARFVQLAEHHTALAAARTARDTRQLLTAQADKLRRRIENGEAVAADAATELAALVDTAGVADEAALREAVARTVRLREATGQLAEADRLLREAGTPIAELERDAEGWSAADLDAELLQLAAHVDRAQDAYDAQATELGKARQVLAGMDDSARAAAALEEVSAQTAELGADVEQYVRVELAREVLRRCIEEYRRDNQGPVLRRAEELFTALTGGRFTRLVVDTEAKKGGHVLTARRAGAEESGEAVGVEAMSEGTRDQLYLALRLATLDRYADADRAMPLVLDDIAMTFDDGRTGELLRVLDAMADTFQIMVFTHHLHLGALAREALPSGRAHVHELPAFRS